MFTLLLLQGEYERGAEGEGRTLETRGSLQRSLIVAAARGTRRIPHALLQECRLVDCVVHMMMWINKILMCLADVDITIV